MHKYPGPGSPEPEAEPGQLCWASSAAWACRSHGHTWQAREELGLPQLHRSPEHSTTAYEDLVAKLFPLIEEKGLSAAVYTQTTDVEIEVNGLMTYDREMVKMDWTSVAAANHGKPELVHAAGK